MKNQKLIEKLQKMKCDLPWNKGWMKIEEIEYIIELLKRTDNE